jgi:hypothetical protein
MSIRQNLRLFSPVVVGLFSFVPPALPGLLNAREAEALVALAPRVSAAWRQGGCPEASTSEFGPDRFLVQVRAQCQGGREGSNLVSDYYVSRSTGAVTEGESRRIDTAEIRSARVRLLAVSRGRELSQQDASCLAIVAFESELAGADRSVSARPLTREGQPEMEYLVSGFAPGPRIWVSRYFTVDRGNGLVRDDYFGTVSFSGGLGALTSKMLDARDPLLLSPREAAEIALATPYVSAKMADSCIALVSDGQGFAEESLIGISSTCPVKAGLLGFVAVNLRTGAVSDPKTHESLSSTESDRTAGRLLDLAARRRLQEQNEVEAACQAGSGESPGLSPGR